MKLTKGLTAKDFSVRDIYDKEVSLRQYKGKRIYLGFFRNVNCPFCNRRVHQIMKNNIWFKRNNIQLILFFESDAEKLRNSMFHRKISPWPLIGDPKRIIYKQYGVEPSMLKMMRTFFLVNMKKAKKEAESYGLPKEEDKDANMSLIPADFFINEHFKIEKAHYGRHLDDHLPVNQIKNELGISPLIGEKFVV